MATINPSIAMSLQPMEIESPLNTYAKFAQIQQMQQANELAKMQAQEYRRGLQEQEQVRNYLSGGADLTSPETLKSLYGFGKTGAEMAQKVMAARKEEREAAKSQEDLTSKIQSRYLNGIGSAQSFKELADVHQAMFNDPVLGQALKQSGRNVDVGLKAIQEAQNSPDPTTAFRDLQLRMAGGVQKYLEMSKPTVMQQGNRLVSVEPISGRVSVVPGSEYQQPITAAEQQRLLNEQTRLDLERRKVNIAEEEAKRKVSGLENLSPKDLQKREASYPQATAAIKGFESKSDSFIKDLEELRNHPGLKYITGTLFGRTGAYSKEGSAAQALYDKVVAKGGFQVLQDMRAASATGGALGNVSNQEGKQLQSSFAAIDRRQQEEDVKKAIDNAIEDIKGSKARMREAYDMTYEYRSNKPSSVQSPAQAPAAPAAAPAKRPSLNDIFGGK